MGTYARNPKKIMVNTRFTEQEYIQLRTQMARLNYTSMSKYIREKVLDGTRVLYHESELTSREVRDKINVISGDISRIGVDYNTLMRDFGPLISGENPRLSPRTANLRLGKLRAMTLTLKERVDRMIELFLKIEKKTESHGGTPDITKIKSKDMMQKAVIVGSVAADAELRTNRDGNPFIVFRVGVTEKVGDEKRSTYYDVTYPNGPIFQYLKKGKMVYVSGKLNTSIYTAKDGTNHINSRIAAREIDLCGPKEQ